MDNIRLWDEDYLKQLKRRVYSVTVAAGIGIGLFMTGFGFHRAVAFVNTKDYNHLVATAQSVEHETRTANYEEAIHVKHSSKYYDLR